MSSRANVPPANCTAFDTPPLAKTHIASVCLSCIVRNPLDTNQLSRRTPRRAENCLGIATNPKSQRENGLFSFQVIENMEPTLRQIATKQHFFKAPSRLENLLRSAQSRSQHQNGLFSLQVIENMEPTLRQIATKRSFSIPPSPLKNLTSILPLSTVIRSSEQASAL